MIRAIQLLFQTELPTMIESSHNIENTSRARIEEAVNQILNSHRFCSAPQLRNLLEYLVKYSLQGEDGHLKERIIGIDVFRRRPDYDTADDPIVRSRMVQLRKRLAQFYQSEEARDSQVQIIIPRGSYLPEFIFISAADRSHSNPYDDKTSESVFEDASQAAASNSVEDEQEPIASPLHFSSKPHKVSMWALAALALCVITVLVWFGAKHWRNSEQDLFWRPLLATHRSVFIYNGTVSVYAPRPEYAQLMVSQNASGEQELPGANPTLRPLANGQTLTQNDVQSDEDDFTGIGNLSAVVDVVQLLTAHHQSFDLRSGPALAFVDAERSPMVLIGSVPNYWTTDMTGETFYFDRAFSVRERGGKGRIWNIVRGQDGTVKEEYAIVSRLLDPKVGDPVIFLAGLTPCGTHAAAKFVTDPTLLKKLNTIPMKDLEKKNLEFVLHVSLVNCEPVSEEVVASRSW